MSSIIVRRQAVAVDINLGWGVARYARPVDRDGVRIGYVVDMGYGTWCAYHVDGTMAWTDGDSRQAAVVASLSADVPDSDRHCHMCADAGASVRDVTCEHTHCVDCAGALTPDMSECVWCGLAVPNDDPDIDGRIRYAVVDTTHVDRPTVYVVCDTTRGDFHCDGTLSVEDCVRIYAAPAANNAAGYRAAQALSRALWETATANAGSLAFDTDWQLQDVAGV